MHPFLEQSDESLREWFAAHSAPAYRVGQVRRWLFEKRASSFHDMTDLPQALREALAADFRLWTTEVAHHHQASDGTEKLLVSFDDAKRVECVLIREGRRRTACISTQVGCAMGCVFCASGLDGVERNLTTSEILEQLLRLKNLLPADERLSHIVVMGMGEPLANLPALLPALDVATRADGLGISARRITISTVGLPPAIDRLAEERHPFRLAVSLHAPNDVLRDRLVPVNRNVGIAAILAAADRYFASTRRRLTFEYVLLGGINDSPAHARELADRLRGRTALVNVIPYNRVEGLPYETPSPAARRTFVEILERGGISVEIRERKGDAIDAACGQLRRRQMAGV